MAKEKRILFTGGGTAGHVMVNLSLIPYFQEQGWEIDYIGSHDGIEKNLISELENVTYHPISTGKLRRYLSLENIKDPFKVLKGIMQARKIIRKRKPDVIFSKGGFVSVPVVVGARLNRVPTISHESDLTPGLANKLATPFVKKVLTTFPETVKYLPEQKGKYVGAVVREELLTGDKMKGFDMTSFHQRKPVIMIMGGSIGAQRINQVIRENLSNLLKSYQVIHICGKGNVDKKIEAEGYAQFEYVSDSLKDLFAITDFIISRAGANAIFEFLALKKPMLLIPLSLEASRGDQIDNAKTFVKNGIAHMLEEKDIEVLPDALERLVEAAPQMKENMEAYENEESRGQVIHIIEKMAK